MTRKQCLSVGLVLLLGVGSFAMPARAGIVLRFDPPNQTIPLGDNGVLSIMLDDTLDVRTIETWATFDPEVLSSINGGPGALFIDTGCLLFNDFDDDTTPGEWYGASIVLGYDCWLTGPGELYRWSFQGIAEGWSLVNAVQVRLFDPDAVIIEDVSLLPTFVFVGGGTAAPAPEPGARLALNPNPFNPAVTLSFGGDGGAARLEVYDLAGRRVARIWEGDLDGSTRALEWKARDGEGRALPSGVYLFRLETAQGERETRRGVLLK